MRSFLCRRNRKWGRGTESMAYTKQQRRPRSHCLAANKLFNTAGTRTETAEGLTRSLTASTTEEVRGGGGGVLQCWAEFCHSYSCFFHHVVDKVKSNVLNMKSENLRLRIGNELIRDLVMRPIRVETVTVWASDGCNIKIIYSVVFLRTKVNLSFFSSLCTSMKTRFQL